MNKRLCTTIFVLSLCALGACRKEPQTGPCESVPASYQVTLASPPVGEQSEFFSRNYLACKKRNLKRDPNALYSVGVSVLHGLGTQKDPMKAFLWFKGAADKHSKPAQIILAQMFLNGVGVPANAIIAQKYLDEANRS